MSWLRGLLAKGAASKGWLAWQEELQAGVETEEGCVYQHLLSQNGTPFYSIVAAAYNGSGHSVFAIVDTGRYEAEECGIDVF